MPQVFNPPPNWPQPPSGWLPPPNWFPDPSWGPAPPGWKFWVEAAERSAPGVKVFLSYRRSDAQAHANGLYDGLSHRLPDADIFMDLDSIPVGADFEEYIRRAIEVCDVVLVLIGDDWLAARPGSTVRRIDEPGDFVRLEIESAFASPRVRVIPVLIEEARMPSPSELPPSLERLARLNAIELSDRRWKSDLERLTAFLRGAVTEDRNEAQRTYAPRSLAVPPPPTTPALPRASPAPERPHSSAYDLYRAPAAPSYPVSRPASATAPLAGLGSERIGWITALLPILCLGLAAFVPFLRAVLLRPHDKLLRKRLTVWGAGLEAAAVVGFVMVGTAPVDAEGTATGWASNVGVVLILVSSIAATVWGVLYRRAPEPE